MDKIIQNAAKKYNPNMIVETDELQHHQKAYFFFRQEAELYPTHTSTGEYARYDYDAVKHTLRHAIPNKGGYFDYIEKKHYDTLQDWATANGRNLQDIVYGVNHAFDLYHPFASWISIETFMRSLDREWSWPTEDEIRAVKDEQRDKLISDLKNVLHVIDLNMGYANDILKKLE